MKRSAWNATLTTALFMLVIALSIASDSALAQQAEQSLNDKQNAGRTLFAQSCVVCHVKVQLTNVGHYGPVLSGMSLGGQEDLMREFISCLLYTSPSPRDRTRSRMPSSA